MVLYTSCMSDPVFLFLGIFPKSKKQNVLCAVMPVTQLELKDKGKLNQYSKVRSHLM